MLDLVSIGAVGIDLYFKGDALTHTNDRFELAVGGKYFTDQFHEGLGGGGANVAIGVRRHGLKTALFSEVGNNAFKKVITEKLEKEKVIYDGFCQFEKDYTNISAILLNDDGEKTIINFRSQHSQLLESDRDINLLKKGRAIYLANMPNISLSERYRMLTFAKHHNVCTFVNIGVVDCRRPKEQLERFLKKVDVLIINDYEFADLVKAPHKDIHWKDNVVQYYLPALTERIVVITRGEKGSQTYTKDKIFFQEAIKPNKILDATGAGDGYTAGFIAGYLKTTEIQESMLTGARYAAKILGKIGAN